MTQNKSIIYKCDYERTSSVTSMTKGAWFSWSSLQSRRTVHDLTLFYKINSGAVIIPFSPPELVPTERRPGLAINIIEHSYIHAPL